MLNAFVWLLCSALLLIAGAGCAHQGPMQVVRGQSEDSFLGIEPLSTSPAPFNLQSEAEEVVRPDEPIAKVLIEGNKTIPASTIRRRITLRPGRTADAAEDIVRKDIRDLYGTRWFYTVEAKYRRTPDGLVLVYKLVERPVVGRVEYVGNKKVKTGKLAGITGLREGSAYSVATNKESVRRIREYYREKGYRFAEVSLQKGGTPEDRDVIFDIKEGPKVTVRRVRFDGNDSFNGELLKTKLLTKSRLFWFFGGNYDPSTIPDDIASLKQYYHSLGYFDVKISDEVAFNEDKSGVTLTYNIEEGERYKVRNIIVQGNDIITEEKIREDFEVAEGDYFALRHVAKDQQSVQTKYGELGRIFAKVRAVPRFLETPGVVDLVYDIDEDKVYRFRFINVNIRGGNPHTRETVALNQLMFAPGELANPDAIRMSKRRLGGSPIWERGGPGAPKINLRPVEPKNLAYSQALSDAIRGQAYEPLLKGIDPKALPQKRSNIRQTSYNAQQKSQTSRHHTGHSLPVGNDTSRLNNFLNQDFHDGEEQQEPAAWETREVPEQEESVSVFSPMPSPLMTSESFTIANHNGVVVRGQSWDNFNNPPNPVFNNSPGGDVFGDQLRNPEPPGFVDADVEVTEARTGRLMFSVGVNSDAGVIGSIVLEEQNFSIMNFPTNMRDIRRGNAFRGNGEQFRIEAVPGDEVSRYLVSWTNPFFMDTDYSVGVSGFYFNRFYRDWEERRVGGRFTVGKLLTRQISASAAFRLEEIRVAQPRVPTPPELAIVEGDNYLSSFRGALSYDTRDSSFMPSEGNFLEGSVEQAVGSFDFTKLEASASQYFTLHSRPDGGGRHILSVRGNLGWTTDNTPVFERFYAGGFQTFRGFEFRGVTPRNLGARVGGLWKFLGTAEYSLPVTVNENIRLVAFTDFGTVEESVSLSDFRVAVGGGVRLTIPQMGPVPISLDWAFPLAKQDADDTQVFAFYIGFTR